jgi:hypothetical protein
MWLAKVVVYRAPGYAAGLVFESISQLAGYIGRDEAVGLGPSTIATISPSWYSSFTSDFSASSKYSPKKHLVLVAEGDGLFHKY